MATPNPTATDLSRVSNVADVTTAKNVERVKTHQQHAHYEEEITPQTAGGVNSTTANLKNPIYTETSHNAHNPSHTNTNDNTIQPSDNPQQSRSYADPQQSRSYAEVTRSNTHQIENTTISISLSKFIEEFKELFSQLLQQISMILNMLTKLINKND